MTKAVDKTFAKESLESMGYKVLVGYQNYKSKMKAECLHGHTSEKTFTAFQNHPSCIQCDRQARAADKLKSLGLILNSEFKGKKGVVTYTCSKGHKNSAVWNNIGNYALCSTCHVRRPGFRLDPATVREEIEREGYKVLVGFEKSSKNLVLQCPNGHITNQKWSKWEDGTRCGECYREERQLNVEELEKSFKDIGYEFIRLTGGWDGRIDYRCAAGHLGNISRRSWTGPKGMASHACKQCKLITPSEIKALFEKEGFEVLKPAIKRHDKVAYRCPNGHVGAVSLIKWTLRGDRCRQCAKYGFDGNAPARLYYLKFDLTEPLYKIGITNRSIEGRLQGESIPYVVLMDKPYLIGRYARVDEQAILRKYRDYQYRGDPVLSVGGNTELFIKDVLCLNPGHSSSRKLLPNGKGADQIMSQSAIASSRSGQR